MLRKLFSTRVTKRLLAVLLTILVTASMFVMLPFFAVRPVSANPDPIIYTDLFYSQPTAQTIFPTSPTWVTNALNARDKNNATFAQFNYGTQAAADSYFEVRTFKSQTVKAAPYPVIKQVDFKMKYGAEANAQGETYKIDYLVSPSTTLQPLQVPTGSAYNDTRVWSAQSEPNDGVWNWTDIGNIKIRVTVSGTTETTESSLFQEYEAWVTVVIVSAPRLFVDPANITDTSKGIGSTFTVEVRLENVSTSAGTEFKLRYDPKVLNITSTTPVPPSGQAEDQTLPAGFIYSVGTMWKYSLDPIKGIFWISYTAGPLASVPPPSFGSGKVATVVFEVLRLGMTTMQLYDSVQGKPGGGSIPCELTNSYFRNVAMPYGATLEITAPSLVNAPFTAQVNISKSLGQSGAFGVFSWEFNMTYDKTVINATAVFEDTFLPRIGSTTFNKIINHANGWVWANSTLNGDLPGAWGNGTIATINFDIVGGGTSPLSLVPGKIGLTRIDYGLGPPSPQYDLPVAPIDWQVVVGLPVARFTFSPSEPKVHDIVNLNASASYDPNGNIVNYSWDFGDGSTGNGMTTTHAYGVKGVYWINLTVTDNDGFTATLLKMINVSGTPVATFTFSPPIPDANQLVTFDASGSFDPDGHIISYDWDFGDGTREVFVEGVNLTDIAAHTYTAKGFFTVTLIVADNDTLVSNPYIQTVNVGGVPVPSFVYTPLQPKVGQTVTFDASASSDPNGNIVSYSWDFGDGAREIFVGANLTQTATHAYGTDGAFVVNLTVTDNDGNSESITQTVTVLPLLHDVAVTSVTAYPILVRTGENVTINVDVQNLGDVAETFDVNVYFNGTLAAPTQPVLNLAIGSSSSLVFVWNTSGVSKGRYQITAVAAQVIGEVNIANNAKVATELVQVSLPPVASFTYFPSEPRALELVTFNASASYDPDGTIAYYKWDFGDGTKEVFVGANLTNIATHEYADIGVYYVNLTVRDDFTLSDSKVQLLNLTQVAKVASTISIDASASLAAIGSQVVINGSIIPTRATKTVTISFSLDGGSWSFLANRTTDSGGKYSYNWTPTVAGNYQLKASWGGDANTFPADSDVISVTFKETSIITVISTPTTATIGESVTISGLINPKRTGVSVSIYYRAQGSAGWVSLASNLTDTDGKYMQNWTPTTVGLFELKASWAGDAKTFPANSTALATLTIKKTLSTITINISESSISLGSAVTITGSLTPHQPTVIIIQYKVGELGLWTRLASVTTGTDGAYSHSWTPTDAGDYRLRAVWEGDASTDSDSSVSTSLSVVAPQVFSIPLYALAALIITVVVILGLVVYFKKLRKP